MKALSLLSHGSLLAVFAVLVGSPAAAADWQGVDGKTVTIDPPKGVSLVVYTNGDLEKETRTLTKSLDNLRPRSDFQLVRIIDLRGDVAPAVRNVVSKKIRRELGKETARLKPVYEAAGNKGDPANDMNTIADFSGSTLRRVGWDHYSENLQAIVYKNGKEVKRFSGASPDEIVSYVKSQLGS